MNLRVSTKHVALAAGILMWTPFLLAEAAAIPRFIRPISDIGAEAQKGYGGDGIGITARRDGALLRAQLQDLEATATKDGLWLRSTTGEDPQTGHAFRLKAAAVLRTLDPQSCVHFPCGGVVSINQSHVSFVREGLREEYSANADGIRQDFVIDQLMPGHGDLRLTLNISGATAKSVNGGVIMRIDGSGREIVYHRLKVSDSSGKILRSSMTVQDIHTVNIDVDDSTAAYPLRIDPTYSDADWETMGSIPGAGATTVYAVVADASGNVYIGGDFTAAGSEPCSRIAKWDGSRWSALGPGLNSWVFSLALGDSGTTLYAGGLFTKAGDLTVNRIAKWNGTTWSALGSGITGAAVASIQTYSGGLYAGGTITSAGGVPVNNIAKWNGTSWLALGTGTNGTVSAITTDGTNVYAGGSFTSAGDQSANRIAKWNGSTWAPLGSGANNTVSALAWFNGTLFAGGSFTSLGGTSANYVGRWDGTSWTPMGSGMNDSVLGLAIFDGKPVAGGRFTTAGGATAQRMAYWNGTAWTALGGGCSSTVYSVSSNFVTSVYAAGMFTTAGSAPASRVAMWQSGSWTSLGVGTNDEIVAMATLGSDLYVAGKFTSINGVAANRIARLSGGNWIPCGTGTNGPIAALAVIGSDLYAGGAFSQAGGLNVNYIAKWNGTSWVQLSSGLSGLVEALTVKGNQLYVGGAFTRTFLQPTPTLNGIACWDGSSWTALGSGTNSIVNALASDGGMIYAGGSFTTAGGTTANRIAKWDGSNWSPLGSGMNGTVSALLMKDGELHAGGSFTTVDGAPANRIAKWTGTAWSTLSSGLSGSVFAMAEVRGELYAGGVFLPPGATRLNSIARWNGSAWSAIGSGIDGRVNTIVAVGPNTYVGGLFSTAGSRVSAHLAKLTSPKPVFNIGLVTNVTARSAHVSGTVNPNGSPTIANFEYGYFSSFGHLAPITLSPNDADGDQPVSAELIGLTSLTTYQYRLVATNANGTSQSQFGSFTTPPALTVSGNGITIVSGDSTPDVADRTDFGKMRVSSGMVTRTFSIHNAGSTSITLVNWGTGLVTVSGGAAFQVSAQPLSNGINVDETTTFQITYDPQVRGLESATVTIDNTETLGNPYSFTIQGFGQSDAEYSYSVAAASAGLTGPDAEASAMPQVDGLANLLKYAFNLDLAHPDSTVLTPGTGSRGLPSVTLEGSGLSRVLRVEFVRRIGSGLTYTPEICAELGTNNWVPLSSSPTVSTIDANWERVIYLEPCAPDSNSRIYS